jgi:UDP-glucose 4-epimerase
MNVLLTGGLGFIGSHTAAVLAAKGHNIVLLDNLSNSRIEVLNRLITLIGKPIAFYVCDVRESVSLKRILINNNIQVVIHFAGLKSVAESGQDPLRYYENNVGGTISLLGAMSEAKINKLIFSSSATVYGAPQYLPYDEAHPTVPMNTYGSTKLQAEQMLMDLAKSNLNSSIISLRYFNPVGAHESGLLGEAPNGLPNNLMPYICQVASGKLSHLNIYGDDYETQDGTGERDFIHVMDLAEGHAAALNWVMEKTGYEVVNLGTGIPMSVNSLISTFESANECIIPRKIQARRPGDLASYYASSEKAAILLSWQAKRSPSEMCRSAWKFQVALAE